MDELNLIELNSPIMQTRAFSPCVTDMPNGSPGNNPFDSVSKHAESLCNPQTKSPISFHTSPTFIEDFFKLGADIQSCGRESLASLWNDDISGRESLGILKLDLLNLSLNSDNLGVPSINSPQFNIVEEQTSKNFSNGLLNTAFLHPLSYCQRKLSILSSNSSVSTNPSSFFNSGSLEASEPSKIYSVNETRNYDLTSKLEDDLNIAFLQTYCKKLRFSEASTSNFETATRDANEHFIESRRRMLSLPELTAAKIQTQKTSDESDGAKNNAFEYERSCRSESEIGCAPLRKQAIDETFFNDSVFIEANHLASKIADGSILVDQCFEENLLDCTSPPSFDDLEENESDDVKIDADTVFKVIDKMLPPEQNFTISDEKEKITNDTPACSNNTHVSNVDPANNNVSSLCQSSNSSCFNTTECKENHKNISNTKNHSEKHSISRGSSSGSAKSRDANELLHDLSEIINHEYTDSKQKREGQQLLCSLANILCSNRSSILSNQNDNLEDSGHSSIEQDEQQNDQDLHKCYEVLDLRVAASKSNENEQVLDLSMSSKVENTNKRLSQSFSFSRPKLPPAKLFNALKTQSSLKSASISLESGKDRSNRDAGKLKPKKIEEKISGAKKGPLKAVIPLGNMSRRNSFSKTHSVSGTNVTPPKVESTLFKVKRTSTPIAEPQLKPIAQSTPDGSKPNLDRSKPISCSSQLKKRKFYCPVSPLARPSSIGDASTDLNKSSHSGSAPNLSNHSGSRKDNSRRDSSIPSPMLMYRRHSATELKVSEKNSLKLKRSYSIGKDLKTPSIMNKMRENVRAALSSTSSKGSNTSLSKLPANQKNSALQERNSGATSSIKSFSLLGRLKKSSVGKENVGN